MKLQMQLDVKFTHTGKELQEGIPLHQLCVYVCVFREGNEKHSSNMNCFDKGPLMMRDKAYRLVWRWDE